MNSNKLKNNDRYFAAANSYGGFISYFNREFCSTDFSRVYVIKGGPGTGKSSFMKKMAKAFDCYECDIEYIFCSSDPKSLDGIKIQKNNKKVAILDGTAPHERDAVVGGAVDEIINLAENWDRRFLISQREKILDIGEEKANAYKRAYFYLSCAGKIDEYISQLHKLGFSKNKAKIKAEGLVVANSGVGMTKIKDRTISSFGKLGYYRLSGIRDEYSTKIPLSGNHYSCALFLSEIYETIKNISDVVTKFHSPLSPERLEGLSLENENCIIFEAAEGVINTDELVSISKVDRDMIGRLETHLGEMINEATRWFEIASDMHFRLEEIYSRAMNFEKNDIIFDKKLEEIKNILEISI